MIDLNEILFLAATHLACFAVGCAAMFCHMRRQEKQRQTPPPESARPFYFHSRN
jgi:hypothetical protein